MNEPHAASIFALHSRLLALKLLPRTGWLQRGQAHAESIAEHSFGVASLALFVGSQTPHIDQGRLLAIALLHDMAEALFGDLPVGARRYFGADQKQEAERRAMCELVQDVPGADYFMQLWDEYAERSTREARLIKQLDRLEMLAQALAYEQTGNRAMVEFWQDIDEGWSDEFPLVRELAEQIKNRTLDATLHDNHMNGNGYHPLPEILRGGVATGE